MPRSSRFRSEELLAAAGHVVAERGPAGATISAIAAATGAPVGSIYHRFASRDLLLAELWLGIVEDFQGAFIAALGDKPSSSSGLRAALHTPAWVRAHPIEARVLLLYRREDFVAGTGSWPAPVEQRTRDLGQALASAMRRFAQAVVGPGPPALQRASFALIDVPYAAVRRAVASGEPPSPDVDALIRETYVALMGESP